MNDELPLVKVAFRDDQGDVETLWAFDLGNGHYKLDSTPWHQYGVSYKDVVGAAAEPDGMLFFNNIISKSGYRTLRVRSDNPVPPNLLEELRAVGCSYEGANPKFVAVDVPPEVELPLPVSLLVSSGLEWEYADPTPEQVHGPAA